MLTPTVLGVIFDNNFVVGIKKVPIYIRTFSKFPVSQNADILGYT